MPFLAVPSVDIPIDIPGLIQFISSIPSGNIILINGEPDHVKSYFTEYVGVKAQEAGKTVSFITSRGKEDVIKDLKSFFGDGVSFDLHEELAWSKWLGHIKPNNLLIIDSFSFMMQGQSTVVLKAALEQMRHVVKQNEAVLILVADDGTLQKTYELLLTHLVDGIIAFRHKETSEGISRFIRILRWMDGRVFDNNIFYTFDDKRINVDLRHRVV